MELNPVIKQSFEQYAGAVLQSRALVDVRDCLKPSARQIFYALHTDKFTHDKPYKKTLKAVGSLSRFYIHGDSSAVGVLMRAGQSFAMRYPLVDVKGNAGNLMESGNWAAQRYTESRLSLLTDQLFDDIEKEVIKDWRDNYDNTEQYPGVLPCKGFYNIVNGTSGIGIGAASSIPQYNLNEVNNALINLLLNPKCPFDDIYCAPDFATGAILLNEAEVKQSMEKGTGFACKLRSVIEYDSNERCFIVKEIPYGVYTNTICGELETILNSDENPGIDRFNDLTGSTPLIKIYLMKKANPDKILKYLYKNTSLQYFYAINMTMLGDEGKYPRVFSWREALQAHIDHEKIVYQRGYEYDIKKWKERLHIVEGLLICLASIDEVVKTIKESSSSATAKIALCKNFNLDSLQAKAVLDLKLSRLAHLEVTKLQNEKEDLLKNIEKTELILNNKELFNNELIKGWREVAAKFGDARRTKILNIENEEDEPTEIRSLQISLTNKNNIFVAESSSLYTQRRNTVGSKMKMENGEYIICSKSIESNDTLLFFSQNGNYYHCQASLLTIDEKIPVEALFPAKDFDNICGITPLNKNTEKSFIIFVTKNGMVKKSLLSEYNIKRNIGAKALSLEDGDSIINVIFCEDENLGLLTEKGNFLIISTKDIRAIGRISKGIKGIKLNNDDYVISAHLIPKNCIEIVSITGNGLIKKTSIKEFLIQGKNTKGAKIQKILVEDWLADFLPLTTENEVLVASTKACLKIKITDIPTLSKGSQGNKSIKLSSTDNVVGLTGY